MEASRTCTKELWTMKEASKEVGCGLPRLYARLRERGMFTRLGDSGRHIPCRKLRDDGMFKVFSSAFYVHGHPRPCPKVKATFEGLMLLQEIADELAREKEKPSSKRSGLPGGSNGDSGESEVVSNSTEPQTASSSRQ